MVLHYWALPSNPLYPYIPMHIPSFCSLQVSLPDPVRPSLPANLGTRRLSFRGAFQGPGPLRLNLHGLQALFRRKKASSQTQRKLAPARSRQVRLFRIGGIQPRLHLKEARGLEPNLAHSSLDRSNWKARWPPGRPGKTLHPPGLDRCKNQIRRQERDQSSREP